MRLYFIKKELGKKRQYRIVVEERKAKIRCMCEENQSDG